MRYRSIEEGELYQIGDQMENPITGVWEPIPQQWIDRGLKHQVVGSIKNFNIKMRRPVND